MPTQTIIEVPHQSLRQTAQAIETITPELKQLLLDLKITLRATRDPVGVGLAAPQIDALWRAFALQDEHPVTGDLSTQVFINPKIVDRSDRVTTGTNPHRPDLEGCLSIPLYYGAVERPQWVTLEWQELQDNDSLSEPRTKTFYDFTGRVIQHELDHLNGVLFTDHIKEQGQTLFLAENDDLTPVSLEVIREW